MSPKKRKKEGKKERERDGRERERGERAREREQEWKGKTPHVFLHSKISQILLKW
jgi:hypothetical protein